MIPIPTLVLFILYTVYRMFTDLCKLCLFTFCAGGIETVQYKKNFFELECLYMVIRKVWEFRDSSVQNKFAKLG